jgi:hypothetical protein
VWAEMPKTPAPTPDDPEQLKRLREMARMIEVNEREGVFDRAFGRVADKAKETLMPSDCRSHRIGKRALS